MTKEINNIIKGGSSKIVNENKINFIISVHDYDNRWDAIEKKYSFDFSFLNFKEIMKDVPIDQCLNQIKLIII